MCTIFPLNLLLLCPFLVVVWCLVQRLSFLDSVHVVLKTGIYWVYFFNFATVRWFPDVIDVLSRKCCRSICCQGTLSKSLILKILMTLGSKIHLIRSILWRGLHSNAIFHSLWQKLFLALPQWLDQCHDILITDLRKRIFYISTTLLTGLWC